MSTETDKSVHAVDIDGVRWSYTDRGAGPLVLFLHGTLASSAMFDGLIDSLADRYRCVAVDWPGHGNSRYAPEGWTSDDLHAGVIRLIGELGAPTVSLVGLSQG
ncbi:MAG: alpha/beta fold hydrolase, partial [Comamonadaceae bacterium]